jgi:hypothetical protein
VAGALRVRQVLSALDTRFPVERFEGTLRASTLRCQDCRRAAPDEAIERGWINRWLKRDDGEWVVLFYCSECALQFEGKDRTARRRTATPRRSRIVGGRGGHGGGR